MWRGSPTGRLFYQLYAEREPKIHHTPCDVLSAMLIAVGGSGKLDGWSCEPQSFQLSSILTADNTRLLTGTFKVPYWQSGETQPTL
jgi:hypothetical protein